MYGSRRTRSFPAQSEHAKGTEPSQSKSKSFPPTVKQHNRTSKHTNSNSTSQTPPAKIKSSTTTSFLPQNILYSEPDSFELPPRAQPQQSNFEFQPNKNTKRTRGRGDRSFHPSGTFWRYEESGCWRSEEAIAEIEQWAEVTPWRYAVESGKKSKSEKEAGVVSRAETLELNTEGYEKVVASELGCEKRALRKRTLGG